ncbi:hypothetical protein HZS_1146 [Henneguya salminicola]|nr:hypothetical protein HZS_1146 [Henneguya salminicola]
MHQKIPLTVYKMPQLLAPIISGLSIFLQQSHKRPSIIPDNPSCILIQYQKNYLAFFKRYISSVTCKQSMQNSRKFELMSIMGGISKDESADKIKKAQLDYNSLDISHLEFFGEDSAFSLLSSRYTFFGIADGVGGYRKYKIDPSLFSTTLMKFCLMQSLKMIKNQELPDCKKIITEGYHQLIALEEKIYGGSTINITCFDHQSGELCISNLGDSRVMVIQPKQNRLFTTNSQQHYFNCPYQLYFNHEDIIQSNPPNISLKTEQFSLKLCHGDIIIIGTDGFFDNMFHEDIIEITKKYDYEKESFPKYYNALLETARKYAFDPIKLSPFGLEYLQQKNKKFIGGKRDDITLIVAIVVKRKN